MPRPRLLEWQWNDYGRFHANALNRALHVVGVPMFVGGVGMLVAALVMRRVDLAVAGPLAMVLGFGMQAIGHRRLEAVPSIPFEGAGDAISRIFAEQFVTFWRFVGSGFRGRRG